MRLQLICATFGRSQVLEGFLRSLEQQSCRNFRILIVDQNSDDRVERVIAEFGRVLPIRRMTSSPPGLCRALNAALEVADGEFIAFPDDDCTYPPNLVERLIEMFDDHSDWDVITARTEDDAGRPSVTKWQSTPGKVSKANVGRCGCSTSNFYRREVVKRVGKFDESIGAEAGANPGFDVDYLHRVVRAGFHVEYRPELHVVHPQTLDPDTLDDAGRRRRYSYGYGEGVIVRKYSVPLWYTAGIVLSPFTRAVGHSVLGHRTRAVSEWLTFRGRLDGWMATKPVS